MWVTFIIDYYMNALCPFFLSYWIHLLYVYMNGISPNSFFFSFIIYGLHGINEKTLPRINHFTTYSYFSFIVFPHVLYAILLQQNEFYMLPFIYYATKSPSLWYVVEYTRNYVIFALCNFVQCSFLLTKMQKNEYKLAWIFQFKYYSFYMNM